MAAVYLMVRVAVSPVAEESHSGVISFMPGISNQSFYQLSISRAGWVTFSPTASLHLARRSERRVFL